MLRYLRELNAPRLILWCYFAWYVGVIVRYFESTPSLWFNSLGLSAIIGTGLYLSTSRSGAVPLRLGRWQVLRLYLMPFCVSSFAAVIKGRGFILIFYPSAQENLRALLPCLCLIGLVALAKHRPHSLRAHAPPAHHDGTASQP